MNNFEHVAVSSVQDALGQLNAQANTAATDPRILAGGTDLLTLMKGGLLAPSRLIDLRPASALRGLRFEPDGTLHIGALTTLAQIEHSGELAQRLPLLPQAVREAATPHLRAMATVAGNLLQRPRCWYYRGAYPCWLKGGSECFARDGQNAHHAILGESPCVAVHPSDLAPALVALDADVLIESAAGTRTLSVADLYTPPTSDHRIEHQMQPGEVIVAVRVPPQPAGAGGSYHKMMERQGWAFALVSAAAQLSLRAGVVERVRLVLGGVAVMPWRAQAAESLLIGQPFSADLAAEAARVALRDAHPLAHNGYKQPMAQELARRALLAAAGVTS